MPVATWDSLFSGRPELIRKMLFGSVLVKDYDAATSLATWSPFDSATGGLVDTITTTDGWQDLGYLDESGVEVTPTFTTADTAAWQLRAPARTDVTADNEQSKIVCLEARPSVEALYRNKTLAGAPTLGASNYKMVKDKTPNLIYRSVLFLGVDGSGASVQYSAKLYPRALMVKPDKQSWNAKTEVQYTMTFQPYWDTVAGFAVADWHDGEGWRAYAA